MKKYILLFLFFPLFMFSQTENDGLFMRKNFFCFGTIYQHNSWNEYWEGEFKRENLNLGTVSTTSLAVMGNYGLTNKLNAIASRLDTVYSFLKDMYILRRKNIKAKTSELSRQYEEYCQSNNKKSVGKHGFFEKLKEINIVYTVVRQ